MLVELVHCCHDYIINLFSILAFIPTHALCNGIEASLVEVP